MTDIEALAEAIAKVDAMMDQLPIEMWDAGTEAGAQVYATALKAALPQGWTLVHDDKK